MIYKDTDVEEHKTETEQNKVISLFQFIKELNKLKQKLISNYKKYPWSFILSDLPDDPEHICAYYRDRTEEQADVEADNENILLYVRKPEFQECPKPDESFAEWLLPGWDDFQQKEVAVKEFISLAAENNFDDELKIGKSDENEQESEPVIVYFKDDEERVISYGTWLSKRTEWVEKQKITAQTDHLFKDLYRFYFELQREAETEEIIVANGMLCDSKNSDIRHPVLTHRVKLEYDADENIVFIKDTEAQSELYTDVFQMMENINISGINGLSEVLQKNDYHPLDRNDMPEFLKVLVHQLSSSSIYSESGEPSDWTENYEILLYQEPCYIVRKRLDGTVKALEKIIENVASTGETPAPINEIVSGGTIEISEDVGEESLEERLAAVGGESADILLSKEANKEQLEIARRIERYNAVLVQGPPGTGKTHTIANLMGHFLAQGKNVLVTSHTTKALNVLKEKVEPGLQSLCVSILDDSNVDMERSVDGITSYMSKTTSFELKREMDAIAVERRDIIKRLADVRRKIFEIIHQECNCIVYNGEEFSPSQIASFVAEHAEDLSYIPGNVQLRAPMPLTFQQLIELYRSNESISAEDEKELKNELPNPERILTPLAFNTVCADLQEALHQMKIIASENNWTVENDVIAQKINFYGELGEFSIEYSKIETIEDLKNYVHSFGKTEKWMKAAAVDGKKGGSFRQRWLTLIEQIQKVNSLAESMVMEQFGQDIHFKNTDDMNLLKNSFEAMRPIFAEKGKIGKLTMLMHKEYGIALDAVTINGKQVQSVEECDMILHHIELNNMRRQCEIYWNELLSAHNVPEFYELDADNPEQVAGKWIPYIEKYINWYQDTYQLLLDKMSAAKIPSDIVFTVETLDSDITAAEKILFAVENKIPAICDICIAAIKAQTCVRTISDTKAELLIGKRGNSCICQEMLRAIQQGSRDAYAGKYADLEQIHEKDSLQYKREEMLKIMESAAPQWADAIRKRSGIHGQSIVPENVEDAWKWKQFLGIINEITEKPFAELQAESIRLSKEYREITALYAEKCSWYYLLRRTEADIDMKQALQGWKLTVKRIGKGTGKQAPALKAKARELMTKCQRAVPGWIMPINRALENLDPRQNRFDVIIIDEASQADISSLAILYMGKKLIIVGDDKQVSPMAVGVDVDKMSALVQMYIDGKIPNAHLYNSKTSIYDIAATTFQPLMLREHFRCVPEIIGFSNMLSYDYKIKPLRDASNSELLPAVVNYRVMNGQREGKSKVNPNEARAIVALMQACMEQPEYKGKTFGVISLLGDEQVKIISRLIEQRLDPRDVVKRKILCGNSSNFQGDERDVVFLSMVDSGDGNGPLHLQGFGTDDAFRKRYNVAASRARDQLWVVDSLDPANDLKPGDIRKTLIEYSLNPQASEISHAEIEKHADSPFEVSVATALTNRGYHLVQQWKVGAYRLDMVAVCSKKTVAIECDGERWHSGEAKIREDMERQTILERLGWRFIRIRGSEYYSNPDKAIERVITELTAYGIQPEINADAASETRDTVLLERVKKRAAIILSNEFDEDQSTDFKTIEAALDPKSMFTDNIPQSVNGNQIDWSLAKINERPMKTKTDLEAAEATSGDEIIALLNKRSVKYVDKRLNDGALWIIGGKELEPIVLEAKSLGVHFKFKEDGGKATKGQPAWWSKKK